MARLVLALVLLLLPAVGPAQAPHFVGQAGASRLWLPPGMLAALRGADSTFAPYSEMEYAPDLLRQYPRGPHARPYAVIADFNGDGRTDVVIDGRSATLIGRIALLSSGAAYRALVLENRPREPGAPPPSAEARRRSVYLSYVPPGRLDSSPELEPAPLDLRHEAFEVGYWEKAAVVYYWDGRAFAEYTTGD